MAEKTNAKKGNQKPVKSFEESLWETATRLRGSVESSEYKHVVLSLIFLKFVSDKFQERRAELVAEGKLGGEFYTPKCVVNLIAEMIEPYKGKIYDPCCGSGGMFVQSIKFVESHHGSKKDISIYGQEFTTTTYKLAKMNLAVRGLSANLGGVPADTFFKDQHPDLKADYIMANPPFNLKDWRADDELVHDARWNGYDTPPTGNANYAWILHMVSKLSEHGVAGFVLANGSMSTNTTGEGAIRQKMIENDLVDCMIALPGQLFYTTQIPVCLWFLTKNKKADSERGYRNREGETLFIDARKIGSMISRTQKELNTEDIAAIAKTYHAWRGEKKDGVYEDDAGYCKSAKLEDIRKHDYVLTPGRYVGAADIEDDGIPFETKMTEMSQTLYAQMEESAKLDETIRQNLKGLGYGQ